MRADPNAETPTERRRYALLNAAAATGSSLSWRSWSRIGWPMNLSSESTTIGNSRTNQSMGQIIGLRSKKRAISLESWPKRSVPSVGTRGRGSREYESEVGENPGYFRNCVAAIPALPDYAETRAHPLRQQGAPQAGAREGGA